MSTLSEMNDMGRPTIEDLGQWLAEPLANALSERYGQLEISLLSQGSMVADGTTVLLLRDSEGQPHSVVLCSAPVSPDMVQRAMNRAHQAKVCLGASDGARILDPLTQGSVHGLSYAVLPYCNRLSESRPAWWIQRELLRPSILDWLWRVSACSVGDVEPASIDRSFAEPLQFMASLKQMSNHLRAAASLAAERLDVGAWIPRHVLMHGDLWKGNILIRPQTRASQWLKLSDRFVITDWAGSEIYGYAMYDLVRLAQSMNLGARNFRREVDRHCHLLQCEQADAMSYLLAALGHIAMNLEHFPIDRYAHMAESCYTTLVNISD